MNIMVPMGLCSRLQSSRGISAAVLATLACVVSGRSEATEFVSVCDRTLALRQAILREVALSRGDDRSIPLRCDTVERGELEAVTSLAAYHQEVTALQDGDLSGLRRLRTLDLSENQIAELPAGFLADAPSLQWAYFAGNPLEKVPLTLRPPLDDETELLALKAREISASLARANRPGTDVRVSPPGGAGAEGITAAQHTAAIALALRQLDELRVALARSELDIYQARIEFRSARENPQTPSVKIDGRSASVLLQLPHPTRLVPGSLPAPIRANAILTGSAAAFEWDRVIQWQRGMPRETILAMLRAEFGRLERIQQVSVGDQNRLAVLIDQAEERSSGNADKFFFTPSEARVAREVQLRTMVHLHRILNTLVRWRALENDSSFELQKELHLLLAWGAGLHKLIQNWFLGLVIGDEEELNFFSGAWWVRKPTYKILDKEVPEGYLELEGHQSRAIPAGSIQGLLAQKLKRKRTGMLVRMMKREHEMKAEHFSGSDLAYEAKHGLGLCDQARELRKVHTLSEFRSRQELWEARIKGAVHYPIDMVILEVAELIGDTRAINAAPAISKEQIADMESFLQPGDILLERRDFFLSNSFLPGFWPHSILYLGPKERWSKLRLPDGSRIEEIDWVREEVLPRYVSLHDSEPARIIESISDGVVFNSMTAAVQKDYIATLRPVFAGISEREREGIVATAIVRALRYLGTPYDFDFDFGTDDKTVCSELVYRSYNDWLHFDVQKLAHPKPSPRVPGVKVVAGRDTMPSNELARLSVFMQDHPEPKLTIGYPGRRLEIMKLYLKQGRLNVARSYEGAEAVRMMRRSVNW